jgi:hypothetical protein
MQSVNRPANVFCVSPPQENVKKPALGGLSLGVGGYFVGSPSTSFADLAASSTSLRPASGRLRQM